MIPSARCLNRTFSTTRPVRVRGEQGDWPEVQTPWLSGVPCAVQDMIARQSQENFADRLESRVFRVVYCAGSPDVKEHDVITVSEGTTGHVMVVELNAGRTVTKIYVDYRTAT